MIIFENIIQNNILFKTFIDDIIIPKLDDIYICGIPRINNFFISKDNSMNTILKLKEII